MLERLILEADKAVTDGMDANSEDWKRYFQQAVGVLLGKLAARSLARASTLMP
jgi:hypothetical protein